jgi:hypothetical protein
MLCKYTNGWTNIYFEIYLAKVKTFLYVYVSSDAREPETENLIYLAVYIKKVDI